MTVVAFPQTLSTSVTVVSQSAEFTIVLVYWSVRAKLVIVDSTRPPTLLAGGSRRRANLLGPSDNIVSQCTLKLRQVSGTLGLRWFYYHPVYETPVLITSKAESSYSSSNVIYIGQD
jgi:hypothetical protein